MLQINDLVLLLSDLDEKGVQGASAHLNTLLKAKSISVDVLKFINDNRQFEVVEFYEKLRKNHNEKKSHLYKNIVGDLVDIEEVITTLHSYALQVNLFSKKLENKTLFFKHSRIEEVTRVLNNYYKDYNITDAVKILKLIKADLLVFEKVIGRR